MRIKGFCLLLLALFVLATPVTVLTQETNSVSEKNQYQSGEAIVCLTHSDVQSMADDELLRSSESLLTLSGTSDGIKTAGDGNITELRLVRSDSLSTEELIKQLKAKPGVRYAEPNYLCSVEQSGLPASRNVAGSDSSDSVYTGDFTLL